MIFRLINISAQENHSKPRCYIGLDNKSGHHSMMGSESDCRSMGGEFDPSQVPYIRGD